MSSIRPLIVEIVEDDNKWDTMQFKCEKKNKRKGRANPRRVHGPEEFHSNICIERVELEICVNRCYQVLANGAFRYSRDFVE